MLPIIISALLPLMVPAQSATNEASTPQQTSAALSDDCITLAKQHESNCRPVLSNAREFFKVCPKADDCSLDEKKEAIGPICSNIDAIETCYKDLTPVCYPKKFSDEILAIFQAECKTVSENEEERDTSTGATNSTGATESDNDSDMPSTDTESTTNRDDKSGSLNMGVNSLFLAFLVALSF